MGGCFSYVRSVSESPAPITAKVVSVNGDLHEYNIPATVSQVLQAETNTATATTTSSSLSSSPSSFFLCNSDRLFYDDYIPSLKHDDELQPNQIYFVLPTSKLQYRLTASDMAALAVKASVALQNGSTKDPHRRKKARISPILLINQTVSDDFVDFTISEKSFVQKPPTVPAPSISRSGSVRRLQKYTSRRAKLAVRSFRLRLSTIYEGTAL